MNWSAIAPLQYRWDLPDHVKLPYQLADRVLLTEPPPWIKSEEVLGDLSLASRDMLRYYARYCISIDYDSGVGGTPDPNWKGRQSRSIQDTVLEWLQFVVFALWLTRRTECSFFCVIQGTRVNGEWLERFFRETPPIAPLRIYENAQLQESDLSMASTMFRALRAIAPMSSIRTATKATIRALTEG